MLFSCFHFKQGVTEYENEKEKTIKERTKEQELTSQKIAIVIVKVVSY